MRTIATIVISLIGAMIAAAAGGIFCEGYLTEEKKSIKAIIKKYIWMFGIFAAIAAVGGFLYTRYGYSTTQMMRKFLVLYTVIAVAKIDKEKYIIPNKAVLFLFGVQIVLLTIDFFIMKDGWVSMLFSSLLGLAIGGVTFLIGYVISRQGIGLGDVKLLAAIGFCLGDASAVTIILLSLIFSAAYGIAQMARKKLHAKDGVPFAPFVAYASVLLLLLGF